LSFKERREWEELPAAIAALEEEQRALEMRINAPEFYQEGQAAIAAALARLESVATDINAAYSRWDALDSRHAKR
jgi:ATP-binding cassette subfamily F protein uup